MTMNERKELLEKLIDSAGMDTVLGELAEICMGKADRCAVNWQDPIAGIQWKTTGHELNNVKRPS
jgi:hypothetical protein